MTALKDREMLGFWLTPTIKRRLEKAAADRGMTLSEMGRLALLDLLREVTP